MLDMLLLQLLVLMVVGVVAAAVVIACGVSPSVFILGEI